MKQVLICGAFIVTLSMGIRHGFGLWLQPITMDRGWSRETFAFALAVQNLAWGLAGPFAGMLADRYGAYRVLMTGSLLYASGLVLMGLSSSGLAFLGSAGILLGLAQSGTTYAIVYGVIARQVDPAKRSWAMGVAAAAGSFGQFLMVPVENGLIGHWGWQNALFVLGCLALAIVPLARGLKEPVAAAATGVQQSIGAALREAFGYPSFRLLMAGYFVCGFQVVFIGVHMPSYLKDKGLGPEVATGALMLIGLFNVFGTYIAGSLGQRMAKRHILAHLRAARRGHLRLHQPAADAAQRLHLLGHHGFPVAEHGAAHECHRGADLWRAIHVHAGRFRLSQPPDRLFPGRLAGRQALRHHGQLRHRLVPLHRPERLCRADQPAGARNGHRAVSPSVGCGRLKP